MLPCFQSPSTNCNLGGKCRIDIGGIKSLMILWGFLHLTMLAPNMPIASRRRIRLACRYEAQNQKGSKTIFMTVVWRATQKCYCTCSSCPHKASSVKHVGHDTPSTSCSFSLSLARFLSLSTFFEVTGVTGTAGLRRKDKVISEKQNCKCVQSISKHHG